MSASESSALHQAVLLGSLHAVEHVLGQGLSKQANE